MKKFVDFEKAGPLQKVIDLIIGIESATSPEGADLIITDSIEKLLEYLQTTDKKVVQVCWLNHHHPMSHLIEDYPLRLRIAELAGAGSSLEQLATAIGELLKIYEENKSSAAKRQ